MNIFRLLLSVCFVFALCHGALLAQPGFEDYEFIPAVDKAGITEAEYNADPNAFRARYFPKLGLPVFRSDYFGIWNWFNHGTFPFNKIYDNNNSKRTYFFCRTRGSKCGHNGVDWLVGFRNYGQNEVINPFPYGATVEVTNLRNDHPDDHADNSLGNSVELTCYLDGNAGNRDRVNKLVVRLSHLKMNSVTVSRGQFVNSGQVLGQIGYSGATSFDVLHAHVTYEHMGKFLDPFYGWQNPNLDESMLFNQYWIESITNWHTRENYKQLTINNAFYATMRNKRTNSYVFRANDPIEHIRVEDQYGNIIPGLDVLDNPNLQNLSFSSYNYPADDGRNWTVYEVSFRWYQDADPSVLNKEMPFRIETDRGELSNRVFIKVTP
ncbi:hypothetical protein APED_26930 [Acanthopleuribacter pedis]